MHLLSGVDIGAIERAGGERDGTGDFWWMEAGNLRGFADELRCVADPLLTRR